MILTCLRLQNLLDPMDIIQIPARICGPEHNFVKKLLAQGKLVVINSPVRGFPDQNPTERIRAAFSLAPEVIVLTGTRTHLQETIDIARSY